jgi:hypothetical protein
MAVVTVPFGVGALSVIRDCLDRPWNGSGLD